MWMGLWRIVLGSGGLNIGGIGIVGGFGGLLRGCWGRGGDMEVGGISCGFGW